MLLKFRTAEHQLFTSCLFVVVCCDVRGVAERRAGSGGRGGAESGDAELRNQTGNYQRSSAAETHEGGFLWQVQGNCQSAYDQILHM